MLKSCRSFVLVFVIMCIFSVSVFGFIDVDENDKYYESITYMQEQGYINGFLDNTFKPDLNVNYNELATILVKISESSDFMYSKIGNNWANSYLSYVRVNNWLPTVEFIPGKTNSTWYLNFVTKDTVSYGVLKALGLPIYNRNFFNVNINDLDSCKDKEYKNSIIMLYKYGISQIDENGNIGVQDTITRGELCDIVYKLKNLSEEEIKLVEPQEIKDLNLNFLENYMERNRDRVVNSLGNIPLGIIDRFNKKGWVLNITTRPLYEVYKDSNIDLGSAIGLCSYEKKAIYVNCNIIWNIDACLYHELGHFIEQEYLKDIENQKEIKRLYKLEGDKLEELTNRDYCKTTTNEFFAEAFYMVVSYSNGTEKMHEKIKTELPETYTYINNFLNGLIETN